MAVSEKHVGFSQPAVSFLHICTETSETSPRLRAKRCRRSQADCYRWCSRLQRSFRSVSFVHTLFGFEEQKIYEVYESVSSSWLCKSQSSVKEGHFLQVTPIQTRRATISVSRQVFDPWIPCSESELHESIFMLRCSTADAWFCIFCIQIRRRRRCFMFFLREKVAFN